MAPRRGVREPERGCSGEDGRRREAGSAGDELGAGATTLGPLDLERVTRLHALGYEQMSSDLLGFAVTSPLAEREAATTGLDDRHDDRGTGKLAGVLGAKAAPARPAWHCDARAVLELK